MKKIRLCVIISLYIKRKGAITLDIFNEQIVKRAKKPKQLIIKIISVIILITVPVVCTVLAFTVTTYMFYIGFFLFIAGIYVVWYVFNIQKVDFEYSVSGGDLDISKIIALRKRKKICRVKIGEIDVLGKGEKTVDGMRFTKTFIAAGDLDRDDENYYAVYNDAAYGKCLLIFSPNEKILEAMKSSLKKDLVLKLFYHRNA